MKLFDYLDKSDQKLPVLVNLVTPQGPEGWIYKQTGKVDRYASLIRTKSPTKWDAQLTESNFQTHPSMALAAAVTAAASIPNLCSR